MKSKVFIILVTIFLSVIFVTQFKLINQPVTDNDEGIYLTSFLLVDKGYPAYKQTYFSQPSGFLLSVYPGFILFGKTLQAARLTIGIWSLIGLLTIIWIAFELKNKWAGLLAIGLLFLIPSYHNQTLSFQSDILITTFSLLSFAFLIRFGKSFRLHWFVFSIFFLNLAFWTKFDITFFPSYILVLFLLFKEKKISVKKLVNLFPMLFIVSLGFFILFILPFGIREVFYNSILLRFQATATSVKTLVLFDYLKKDIVLSLVIILALILSILKINKFKYLEKIIFIWSSFVFILLLFYRPLFPHHLAVLTVPIVFLFSQLTEDFFKDKKIFQSLVIIVMIISLSNRIYQTATSSSKLINDQQQKAIEIIKKYSNINDVMISDEEILNGLSGRLPPLELSDTSFVRIKSNNLTSESFKQIVNKYKPKLIIPWNGRLESIKNFKENLSGYQLLTSFSNSKNIYIRIEP